MSLSEFSNSSSSESLSLTGFLTGLLIKPPCGRFISEVGPSNQLEVQPREDEEWGGVSAYDDTLPPCFHNAVLSHITVLETCGERRQLTCGILFHVERLMSKIERAWKFPDRFIIPTAPLPRWTAVRFHWCFQEERVTYTDNGF